MAAPFDTGRPHPARVYDYLLGGKDHFAADREAAVEALKVNPNAATAPLQNRAFLRRAVHHLAAEAGVRQFLDIGTGLPTSPNVHDVAQAAAPASKIVYVDNDPIVLSHARALLTSTPEGRTAYVDGDLLDIDGILAAPELRSTLDLTRPVGLLLFAILHFVEDDTAAYRIVERLMAALPSGSYLVLSHITADFEPESWGRFVQIMRARGIPSRLRDQQEVSRFFTGLDLVEPGVVPILRWRPDDSGRDVPLTDAQAALYGGVARKP
ncbi:SAM-dependent methyltransferase [Dactylosporangium sp. AC04546]|uniref:SAM-dependent methyltransferase n=1 Tax=Dactylosporangium sp. AC04546 TaxID=2862460 RepID=UPI001EDE46C6|nr:SAM-dependent methyltransferase [Dactylosporangium sp. AC04546]WVK88050.1 SAM-dependent methyltransferase [Dactylosporangium sp. AC04546]